MRSIAQPAGKCGQRDEDADHRGEPADQHQREADLVLIPFDQRRDLAELHAGKDAGQQQDDDDRKPSALSSVIETG